MLPGVVPFPAEFAQRYRDKGYWLHKPLREEFAPLFKRYADRVFLIDGARQFTYGEIDRLTDNLALNLLAAGFKPLDRLGAPLPKIAQFVLLYFALQKISGIPIASLAAPRYNEISQFVELSQASACVYPERLGDF